MKFFAVAAAAIALVSGAAAAPAEKITAAPAKFVLNDTNARDIVHRYASVLQNQTFQGLTPYETTMKTLAEGYAEYSDSIASLISLNNTLGDQVKPSATSRAEWFAGVTRNPVGHIETHHIKPFGHDAIVWFWTFSGVGINKYPVKGFNLLHLDANGLIDHADIEFNSIAWGVDIFAIHQYCGAPPAGH